MLDLKNLFRVKAALRHGDRKRRQDFRRAVGEYHGYPPQRILVATCHWKCLNRLKFYQDLYVHSWQLALGPRAHEDHYLAESATPYPHSDSTTDSFRTGFKKHTFHSAIPTFLHLGLKDSCDYTWGSSVSTQAYILMPGNFICPFVFRAHMVWHILILNCEFWIDIKYTYTVNILKINLLFSSQLIKHLETITKTNFYRN